VTDRTFRILGIAGSLRRASYNRGLIRAAQRLALGELHLESFDIAPIPLFNQDVLDQGEPEPVRALKQAIRAADALLIATPEYNYSIPGVLKNAIDWASRPPDTSPLRQKPIALVGASSGRFGTTRSQLALRQVFVFTDSYVMPKPELMIPDAAQYFDHEGNLLDQAQFDRLRRVLDALLAWARHFDSA
jgi:chromate reductase